MGIFDRFKKNKPGEEQQDWQHEPEVFQEIEENNEGEISELEVPISEQSEPEAIENPPIEDAPAKKPGFFSRLKEGLGRTRDSFTGKLDKLISSTRKLDEEFFEEMEEILIGADVGVDTTLELVNQIRKAAKSNKIKDPVEVKSLLKDLMVEIMGNQEAKLAKADSPPTIILMVGVNGVGKTTTIAKLSHRLKSEGNRVILAAGDTFRAAAIDQLQIWADRVGVDMIRQGEGADPAAVVFDAIAAARARRADYLIIDTAGRLHNKTNLMQEIAKVRRVIEREIPDAPHECLLVLDATTGQNAISQARQFKEATGVTGLVLTKLDGTAKGGITVAVARELDIPVKMIGIGEQMDDLREFVPGDFIEALFATGQD